MYICICMCVYVYIYTHTYINTHVAETHMLHKQTCCTNTHVLTMALVYVHTGRDIEVKEEGITGPYSTKVIIGEGMPVHGVPSEAGKLKIQMKVKFPKSLNAEQKDQINALLGATSY